MARISKLVLAAAVAFPLTAIAQDTYTEGDTYEERGMMGGGIGVQLNAGVNSFSRNNAEDFIEPGAGYGVGIELRPQRNIGLELTYQGAVNDLDSSVSSDGSIIMNQVGGNLRLNAVPPTSKLPANLTPFVFGGATYSRFDTNDFTPGFQDDVDAFSIPVGAGLEADIGPVLVGARFTYSFNLNNARLLPGDNGVDNWLVTGNIGTRLGD